MKELLELEKTSQRRLPLATFRTRTEVSQVKQMERKSKQTEGYSKSRTMNSKNGVVRSTRCIWVEVNQKLQQCNDGWLGREREDKLQSSVLYREGNVRWQRPLHFCQGQSRRRICFRVVSSQKDGSANACQRRPRHLLLSLFNLECEQQKTWTLL